MAKFVKGDVVVIPFPFSDLSGSKRRPALVLADLPGDDIILCQITSQQHSDKFAVPLTSADFDSGNLPVTSNIRPTRIFTADKNIIVKKSGTVKSSVLSQVTQVLFGLLS
ncbi:MAG: type II toxin-antitoxin system PemK/MazF family toxin [Bacteroidota bacterium]